LTLLDIEIKMEGTAIPRFFPVVNVNQGIARSCGCVEEVVQRWARVGSVRVPDVPLTTGRMIIFI